VLTSRKLRPLGSQQTSLLLLLMFLQNALGLQFAFLGFLGAEEG
jgi:hypothetical protein